MKNLYMGLALLLAVSVTQAQHSPTYDLMVQREMLSHQTMSRGENEIESTGLDYDVKYYRLVLRLNPDTSIGKYVRGSVTTYFTTNAANFSLVKFDFAAALGCDSVYYHGAKLPAGNKVEDADTLKITIPTIAAAGTLDSITVYYKGVPPVVSDFSGTTGFIRGNHTSGNYIYTLSEPYSASTWWPCKARVASDKADSVDMIISTPSTFRVAANGKRISELTAGGYRVTTWKHRYPISSYQVAIGVANYVQVPASPTIVNIGGTNMELYNLLWNGTNTTAASTSLNRTAEMLTVMSNAFSDYPFKNEKYGHYTFGFSGGMEHNTFSGMGTGTYNDAGDWSVIAHELGHQWFGAAVTCGSWRDIWVNEGFARYSEVVYLEGKTDASITTLPQTHRAAFKTTAKGANAKPIYQADTTTMTAIFSPSSYIYERGAMFISMLRKTLGDAKFFQALKNYQTDPLLQYGNAFTDDVKRHMEDISGLDLDEMFADWIYKKGHALYSGAQWNNAGNQIVLQLPQTVNAASDNSHFDMPLVIRISRTAPAADTTIVLFDRNGVINTVNDGVFTSWGSNIIQLGLSFTPTTVTFDPLSEVLADGVFTKNAGLALLATNVVEFTAKKEGKNADLLWTIDQAADYSSFEIERSSNGTSFEKIASQFAAQNNGARSFTHTDYNIPSGRIYYRIKIIENDGSYFYTKVASIINKATEAFVVSPNPATDHVMISHSSQAAVVANIRVVDNAGRTVKSLLKQTIPAAGKLRVPLQDLGAGNYYVEIDGDQYFKMTHKIVLIK